MRGVLVPFLNEKFPGWQKAVLNGAKKAQIDEKFLSVAANSFFEKSKNILENQKILKINCNSFLNLSDALRRRVFFLGLNKIGFGGRFPFSLFEKISNFKEEKLEEIFFENLKISFDSENLLIQNLNNVKNSLKSKKKFIESGFSFLISKIDEKIEFSDFVMYTENAENLFVEKKGNSLLDNNLVSLSFVSKTAKFEKISFFVTLPFLLRSFITGDEIKTSDGKLKSVKKIFSDWKIPQELREKIPLIEENPFGGDGTSLKAIIASPFGFKNWIEKTDNLI